MIAFVTGQPGAGKTFYAVRLMVQALREGKYVATNVEMVQGWEDQAARFFSASSLKPGARNRRTVRYRKAAYVAHGLPELSRLRLPGTGESRGIVVLDEAHLWLNTRDWRDSDRKQAIAWFTQHRKLGWDVYLISQYAESVDRQVRALAEYEITLRNLKRARFFGVPVSPVNLFLALWFWNGHHRLLHKREMYRLDRKLASLYETLAVHDAEIADPTDGPPLVTLPVLDSRVLGAGRRAVPILGDHSHRARNAKTKARPHKRGPHPRHPITGEAMRFDPLTGERLLPDTPADRLALESALVAYQRRQAAA